VPGNVRLALVTELDDTQTNIWRLRCIYKIIKSGRCCKITPYILYFALRVALHYVRFKIVPDDFVEFLRKLLW